MGMRLGAIANVEEDPDKAIGRIRELGFPTCQVRMERYSAELAGRLRAALGQHQVEATAVMELGPGPKIWDFVQGPLTVGLVPPSTRRARIEALKNASDFAKQAGIPAIHTHCGFIPEDPNSTCTRKPSRQSAK